MSRVRKVWHLRPHDPDAVHRLAAAAKVSSVVAQLLLARGVSDAVGAKKYLSPALADLHPPSLLPGIGVAAEKLLDAARTGRAVRVYGDYDVDGVTGTAVLVGLLRKLGANVEFYIPDRMGEGYGLNRKAVESLRAGGADLLVTVDCGVTAVAEVEAANRIGLEVIITDHHQPLEILPDAVAVVHPSIPGSRYPFAGLSGSGVAFKLAWEVARLANGGDRAAPEMREFLLDALGLAALGLVADVVPLGDENRILVKHGLDRLAKKPTVGIRALVAAAGVKDGVIRAEDVSFRLAPRLNAAGRLGCALLVVELLTTASPARAKELAECLEGYNTQRQTIERRIAAQAREQVEANGYDSHPAIVLASPDWHQGVIGIVAGRLVEHFARPVVLVAARANDEPSTGSGRSVAGFDLHAALRSCGDTLVGCGGHAMAAGVKVRPSRVDEFRERFVAYAASHYPDGFPAPRLPLDAEVPLSALTFGLLKDIDKLEPYGEQNTRPRFLAAGLTVENPKKIGTGERHLSFRVRQGGTSLRCVAWSMADRLDELMSAGGRCCLAFTPKVNEWNGYTSVEMEVADLIAGDDPRLG